MESQPQNPEFRINPENFHALIHKIEKRGSLVLPPAAYPDAKDNSWQQINKLSIKSRSRLVLPDDNPCKQNGLRSDPTKLVDTLMVIWKDFVKKKILIGKKKLTYSGDYKKKCMQNYPACRV